MDSVTLIWQGRILIRVRPCNIWLERLGVPGVPLTCESLAAARFWQSKNPIHFILPDICFCKNVFILCRLKINHIKECTMNIYSLQVKNNPNEGVYKCAFLPWTASTDTPKVVLTKYFLPSNSLQKFLSSSFISLFSGLSMG
jgi:hypothetical protein